jgi:hypothetical protein
VPRRKDRRRHLTCMALTERGQLAQHMRASSLRRLEGKTGSPVVMKTSPAPGEYMGGNNGRPLRNKWKDLTIFNLSLPKNSRFIKPQEREHEIESHPGFFMQTLCHLRRHAMLHPHYHSVTSFPRLRAWAFTVCTSHLIARDLPRDFVLCANQSA